VLGGDTSGIAGERRDVVPIGERVLDHEAADGAGGAEDGDVHDVS
jgi:hypothetical protein